MNITVRLFAMLKEQAGSSQLELDLPAGASVADAVSETGRQAGIERLIERMPLAHAVNREYAELTQQLSDGDELALIPPVSGGAEARIHAAIVETAPSSDRLTALVTDPAAGAIVTFSGVTREVDRLEYEAYDEMAQALLTRILEEVAAEHELLAIAAEHRVGAVALSQPSIVIAASAAHRGEAFAGARAAIDRIKQELPIWKREVTEVAGAEQSEWVEGVLP